MTRFTPTTIAALLAALEDGKDIRASCAAARIARGTFYEWLDAGKRGIVPYDAFLERVSSAIKASNAKRVEDVTAAIERFNRPSEPVFCIFDQKAH